ncbi:MAG: hypothetical protein JWL72_2195 [Ilumatobacteraceae bacterium]|nr:hypothetical protein [Ilumatobacteraceae bacterium]
MRTRESRVQFRGAIALGVALVLVLVSCSSTSPSSAPTSTAGAAPPVTSAVADTAVSTPSPTTSTPADETPTADGLAGPGLIVVPDEAAVAAEAQAGLMITDVQARRLSADVGPGAGLLGSDLDRLAPVSDGAPPMSYLLAAWVSAGTSPGSEQARQWMGDQDWTQAPLLRFPAAAVALFVAEIAAAVDAETPGEASPPAGSHDTTTSAESAPSVTEQASSQGLLSRTPTQLAGPCSAVENFIAKVIGGLFDALRITPSSGSGIFDLLTSAIATIWNVAIGLAQGLVEGLVKTLTAPVFQAIRFGVGALGVATIVLSYFKDQTLDVTLDPAASNTDVYHFAIGAEGDVAGTFIAKGKELTADWPPAVVDCAKVAGATLPKLIPPGAPATWTVTDPVGVIAPSDVHVLVDNDLAARLAFVTSRESEEQAKGEITFDVADVTVKIPRDEVKQFLALARDQVNGARGQLLGAVPAGPLRTAADTLYAATVDPTLNELQQSISGGAANVFSLTGSGVVVVKHHAPPETTTTASTVPSDSSSPDTQAPADFCSQYRDLVTWIRANPPGDVVAWATEIVDRLTTMRPSAPVEVLPDVDVELQVYGDVAASANAGVIGNDAVPLGQAAQHLGTLCGVASS